jgi:hypothetical protein
MFRFANLFMLSLILLCSAPAASAEDVSTVVDNVKAIVKEKAACWKLYHQQERKDGERTTIEVNWVCGKEGVIAYLYQEPSVEAAVKLLYEIRTSPVQSLAVVQGAPPLDAYQFGDETVVRSYLLYSSSSYVFFRKGKIVVRIDSGTMGKASSKRTFRNAVRFAQWFADLIPTPNNSLNRTRN